MTRINVGISPRDLCDQHLLAELRELPRAFAYSGDGAPDQFCLGKGHVLWCARHQGSLFDRLDILRVEGFRRGFKLSAWPSPILRNQRYWTKEDEAYAAPIVQARIADRLRTMSRQPRWTYQPLRFVFCS